MTSFAYDGNKIKTINQFFLMNFACKIDEKYDKESGYCDSYISFCKKMFFYSRQDCLKLPYNIDVKPGFFHENFNSFNDFKV